MFVIQIQETMIFWIWMFYFNYSSKSANAETNYFSFLGKEKTALLFEKEKKELLELLTKLNYPTER